MKIATKETYYYRQERAEEGTYYYLYLMIDKHTGDVRYVGITKNRHNRFNSHDKRFSNYCYAHVVATSYYLYWIQEIEKAMIRKYATTIENIQHNDYRRS